MVMQDGGGGYNVGGSYGGMPSVSLPYNMNQHFGAQSSPYPSINGYGEGGRLMELASRLQNSSVNGGNCYSTSSQGAPQYPVRTW